VDVMRSKQLFEIYHKKAYPDRGNGQQRLEWEQLSGPIQWAWYCVAIAEAESVKEAERLYWDEYTRLKQNITTMVSRKHYNDAIKSLSVCQKQIETLMLEIKRWNPTSRIAQDARTILDLLEAMIDFNPDMRMDKWKDNEEATRFFHPTMSEGSKGEKP
jgi:hypothetical protein